jgi:hypothetical protein
VIPAAEQTLDPLSSVAGWLLLAGLSGMNLPGRRVASAAVRVQDLFTARLGVTGHVFPTPNPNRFLQDVILDPAVQGAGADIVTLGKFAVRL